MNQDKPRKRETDDVPPVLVEMTRRMLAVKPDGTPATPNPKRQPKRK